MAGKLSFFWFFLLSFSFTDTFANGASPTYLLRPSGLCHVWSGLWGVLEVAKENNKQVLQSRF